MSWDWGMGIPMNSINDNISDNPLLEACDRLKHPDTDAPRYGKAARNYQRQLKRQQTEHIALTTLEKYLPRLFHSPPHTEQFESLWPHFIEGLGLACNNEVRYRETLNVILKLLHLGNSRQCWSLPLPTLALEVKRTPQRQVSLQRCGTAGPSAVVATDQHRHEHRQQPLAGRHPAQRRHA